MLQEWGNEKFSLRKILPSPAQVARGHPSKTEYTFRYDQVYSDQMSQDNCDSPSPMQIDSE